MAEQDHFTRLGLPRRFTLDPAALERNYLAASRAAHPDHAGNTPAALETSARVNEAYATLRDEFKRAEYLLRLAGGPLASAVGKPPAEFLEEMLELRMAIEEAKADESARTPLAEQLSQRRAEMLRAIGGRLDAKDVDLPGIREQLNAAKFINGLLRDLEEE